jgi:hypothetical protein
MDLSRSAAVLICSAALAGCAGVPVEELLASSAIVAELRPERGAQVEAARFSAGRAGEAPPGRWEPFVVSRGEARTDYRLADTGQGVVLEALADGSVSGFYRRIRIDPRRHPVIEWRWRVLQPPAEADPRISSRDDSPARLVISFHGDVDRLDFQERITLRLYHALSGEKLPYAMLIYAWSSAAPAGTTAPSVHTDKIQTIVVDRGSIGEWREFRRNVFEDYQRVFGEEPWDIVAVGVMTDTANSREKARAQYGDVTFLPAR